MCQSRQRRNCEFVSPSYGRNKGGRRICQRIAECDWKNRNQCNELSPDCRWDNGRCVRKFEGESRGPVGNCHTLGSRECQRAMHCMENGRGFCIPNMLGELLDTEEEINEE